MITVSAFASTVAEGATGTITVSRTVVSSQALTVFYSVGGTARLGIDYSLSGSAGQVVIPAGQSSATIVLHAMNDGVSEKSEKIKFKLINGAGYTLPRRGSRAATITLPRH